MTNKQFFTIIVFFTFTAWLIFVGCAKKKVDTTAPSIEDQTFMISDSLKAGELVGEIEASDDNGVTSFNIEDGNTANIFAFDTDNKNNLTVVDPSDFATISSYTLMITVSDAAGNRATANITINLTNAPPVIENQDFLISDTSVAGDPVGLVVAYDIRDITSYTITEGNTGTAFALDNNGNLTVADPADFATTMEYTLTIEVSDEMDNTATATITITVGDTPPIIPDGQAFQIREHSLANTVVDKLGTTDDKLVADDDRAGLEYQIIGGNDENIFTIDNNGIITLTAVDIDFETTAPPEYVLTIEVTDTGDNTTSAKITIAIVDVVLVNVDNVIDNANLQLDGVASVTTATVGSTTFLFVAGALDDGVSVFSVANDGMLTSVTNVSDDDNLKLDEASSVMTATVGSTTYLFVAGNDDGVSVFSVADNGMLTSITNVSDDANLELNGVLSVTTATVGSTPYLFVAGNDDDGVSVFSVANNGMLTSITNVSDDANLELNGVLSVTTATVRSTTYLFVAGFVDDGVSVFSVANDGMLTSITNVSDDANLELDGATSVTTTTVGSTPYLFVAGFFDDGVSVFSVADNGMLTSITNVSDDANLELEGAISVTTSTVGSTTYLFVAGFVDDGVSVFSVADNGMLTSVDNANLELKGATSVTTATVGSTPYLFVAGLNDDVVSVFRVEE